MSFFSNTPKQVNGRIGKVEILPLSDVFNYDYRPGNTQSIAFPKSGNSFQPIVTSPFTTRLRNRSAATPNGMLFSFELKVFISSIDKSVAEIIKKHELELFFVKIHTDRAVLLFPDMKLTSGIEHSGVLASFSGFPLDFVSETILPWQFTTADPSPPYIDVVKT